MTKWANLLANGVRLEPGSPAPVRKELRDLSDKELYLFLEGLEKLKRVDKDDPLSYFQLAGIHGVPYRTPWPRTATKEELDVSKGALRGFCTHTSIIFLTWHRPYLALFESALHRHVQDVAIGIPDTNPEKGEYLLIAKNLRLPYWDWARPDRTDLFPSLANQEEYTPIVPNPNSTASDLKENAVNPLFNYKFPRNRPNDISETEITERYPQQNELWDLIRNPQTADKTNIRRSINAAKNLSERVAYILKSYGRYDTMSNNRWFNSEDGGNPDRAPLNGIETWGSLEGIHNTVHNAVGGGGHMGSPATAAFDPIFWLHHCNIDRLFAIWQGLHDDGSPDAWVTKRKGGDGTAMLPRGSTEDASTKLYPFKFEDSPTGWFDSTMVKRTERFGYAYPETLGLSYPVSKEAKAKLTAKVDAYYQPLSRNIQLSKRRVETAGQDLLAPAMMHKAMASQETVNTATAFTVVPSLPPTQELLAQSLKPEMPFLRDLAPDNKYLEWLVNIKALKHSLRGRYQVHIFLGPVQEDNVILWPLSPNHVGMFSPFGQTETTGCEKCQQDQDDNVHVTGQIPLTVALAERYLAQLIPDLGPTTVVDYLKRNMHWRATLDGTVIDRSRVDGLIVAITSNEVTLPDDDGQPVYSPEVKVWAEATTNLAGDAGRGNDTGYAGPDGVFSADT
ncbi:Di-copper centre-containing protein [Pseudovirgaria hyperparasitica]|uniref:tyrosinase n=1 Tax=Pseudovirgaria hyperparasitica TaxID=470096 RepID=A0A6A6VVH4_9PEZI|nr:Di-copper centre-containing protein [Pseudovirgaria hyperparasitica]KAF2753869.1 Di-copper centre-containing protein [Pseudovirgaria hyperparasitica]